MDLFNPQNKLKAQLQGTKGPSASDVNRQVNQPSGLGKPDTQSPQAGASPPAPSRQAPEPQKPNTDMEAQSRPGHPSAQMPGKPELPQPQPPSVGIPKPQMPRMRMPRFKGPRL